LNANKIPAALSAVLLCCFAWPPADAAVQPQIYGHRGGRRWAPENTLASFRRCVEKGYGIELDIHKCKTGELVVIHDEELSRTTDGSGLIKDKTLTELRGLTAGRWFKPEFADEKIPLLSEVLSLVDGKVPIYIEIKNLPIQYPGIEDDLLELLKNYRAKDSITIISFDHEVLHRIHEKAPNYKLGFLDCAVPCEVGGYAKKIGASGWFPDIASVRASDVARAHAAGISVSSWTLNKPSQWHDALSFGINAIITDDPAGLAEYLSTQQ
jgi:glycerophosphoryl diester phosphodiesterase